MNNPMKFFLCVFLVALASGCTTLQPKPLSFSLIQGKDTFNGYFHPIEKRMEVNIGDKHYTGFYIQAMSSAVTQSLWIRRGFPGETMTTVSSNSARSVMTSSDGERLFCEFLFEGNRALGECKTTGATSYQLIAN